MNSSSRTCCCISILILLFFGGSHNQGRHSSALSSKGLSRSHSSQLIEHSTLGHGTPNDVTWSPDGNTFAVASTIGIWLYEASSLENPPKFLGHHEGNFLSVEFSPNSSLLVSASTDGQVHVWDTTNSTEKPSLASSNLGSNWMITATFDPTSNFVAGGGSDYSVHIWDISTSAEISTLAGHSNWIHGISFNNNGNLLAVSSGRTLYLWEFNSRSIILSQSYDGLLSEPVFSPNGDLLAIGIESKGIVLLKTNNWKESNFIEAQYSNPGSIVFSPDSNLLASTGSDKNIHLWNTETGQEVRTLEGHKELIKSLAFSPSGRAMASVSLESTVYVWDLDRNQISAILDDFSAPVNDLDFSPDAALIATATGDLLSPFSEDFSTGIVNIWDVENGTKITTLYGHSDIVQSVAFSPDGQTLASASKDGSVKLWDTKTWDLVFTLPHTSAVTSVAFSPDGQTLASASKDGSVKLWDIRTGQETISLQAQPDYDWSQLAYIENGAYLSLVNWDNINIWNMQTQEQRILRSDDGAAQTDAVFIPDLGILVSGSFDNKLFFWNIEEEDGFYTQPLSSAVSSLTLNSMENLLAFADLDGYCHLWDIDKNQEILVVRAHFDRIWDISFNPEGNLLALGSQDGTVTTWKLGF